MRLYQLHMTVDGGVSAGYQYFSAKRDALRVASEHRRYNPKAEVTVEEVNIVLTKAGVIKALNHLASHPDNG